MYTIEFTFLAVNEILSFIAFQVHVYFNDYTELVRVIDVYQISAI